MQQLLGREVGHEAQKLTLLDWKSGVPQLVLCTVPIPCEAEESKIIAKPLLQRRSVTSRYRLGHNLELPFYNSLQIF